MQKIQRQARKKAFRKATDLGGEDAVVVLAAVLLGVVLLHELALLELDGVVGEVDLPVGLLELTDGRGAAHELGVHSGLGRVLRHLGREGVGGAVAEGGAHEGEGELHRVGIGFG